MMMCAEVTIILLSSLQRSLMIMMLCRHGN